MSKPNAHVKRFGKLRDGKIHLRCYVCGRKMSNTDRDAESDPSNAVLIETPCPKCAGSDKGCETFYYDAQGETIEWDTSDAPKAVSCRAPYEDDDNEPSTVATERDSAPSTSANSNVRVSIPHP